ncbi:MAG TPA: peptide chain release factor N(5)-glutamine methyltransferase [Candidatus Kapabacteria bacterium]|nr:peptide chain release factor N(5)-glutamine methyltransferase [Candidatus Kapabacteria bacterium]
MTSVQTEIWTILRLITWGADYFKKKGVDSPRLTMELLLAHVLKLRRFDLYMQFDRPLSEAELEKLRALVKRRAAHEPLQYIIGETQFYRRMFKVNPSVLIPRPETEILVQESLRRVHGIRCLDAGTGSGCIGITIALERPDTEVIAIDSSEEALELARSNAEELGARNITFRHADLFDDEAMRALGSFDVVVSNPPYIPPEEIATLEPEVRDHEPRMALTDENDGFDFYRRFIELAPRLLREGASMFFEIGFGQAERLGAMYRSAGFDVDLLTDLEKVQRILWARFDKRIL